MRKGIQGGQCRILSENQIKKIHYAALSILEKKGVKIKHEHILNLLKEHGCEVDFDSEIATIPQDLVEECIEKAPKNIKLSGRDEKNDFILDSKLSFFGAGTGTTSVLDLDTGEKRSATKKDLAEAARLSDALPNIDYTWVIFTLKNNPALGFHQLYAALAESAKHTTILNWYGGEFTDKLIDMIAAVVGGRENLSEKPIVSMYAEPVSPLIFRAENMEAILKWTDTGLPLIWWPAQKPGATSPITFAGNLAQGLAESLGGNVIAQLNNPGTPVILGASPGAMDMRNALNEYVSAEMFPRQCAVGQWGRYYQIPTFGTGGCTNSYNLDFQAGVESTLSLYGAVLGGQNLIHDLSFAGAGDLGSLELLVLTDEMTAMAKKAIQQIDVNEETLALSTIQSSKDYFLDEQTVKLARTELFTPELLRRVSAEKEDFNLAVQKAKEKREHLLKNHQVEPLPSGIRSKLQSIISEAQDHFH